MLSIAGRCFTFDEAADGYARGEGSGAFCLAAATGVYHVAAFAGSSVNQDGRSATITAPNGPSQQAVIRAARREARVSALETAFCECHGTGTGLGDPIEMGSLQHVEADQGARESPL
jgi:acyl transferase domain-containing protein